MGTAAPLTLSDPTDLLQRHFGHADFRPGQRAVIEASLAGEDVVALMPTGRGKSICYQLPALALGGTTLVVSPLIALMKDQVDALSAKGIPATFINSSLGALEVDDRLELLAQGAYRLVYVAPERFRNKAFLAAIGRTRIDRVAVDEAHCVSQWGHDFRPDYLRIAEAIERLGRPAVLAATATATPEVREDIARQLRLREPRVFVSGFDRPNLRFVVRPASGEQGKLAKSLEILSKVPGSAIVYAATRKNVDVITERLRTEGYKAVAYHAGLTDTERMLAQDDWMDGTARIVVATNAFGMGVDKANVRLVLHYDLPGTLEAYYQEAGRAGRDGKASYCVLLYSAADRYLQEFFIGGTCPSVTTLEGVYAVLCGQGEDEFVMTHDAISRQLPGSVHDMAIGTCLNLLERQGVIARGRPDAQRRRAIRVLQRERTFQALGLDVAHMVGKEARELRKLDAMESYATTGGCRRAHLLGYFGEETEAHCGSCDRCLDRGEAPRPPTPAPQRGVGGAISPPPPKGGQGAGGTPLSDPIREALLDVVEAVAREQGLPRYCILHDRVMERVARERPRTLEALVAIPGVGPQRAAVWGERAIAAIGAARA